MESPRLEFEIDEGELPSAMGEEFFRQLLDWDRHKGHRREDFADQFIDFFKMCFGPDLNVNPAQKSKLARKSQTFWFSVVGYEKGSRMSKPKVKKIIDRVNRAQQDLELARLEVNSHWHELIKSERIWSSAVQPLDKALKEVRAVNKFLSSCYAAMPKGGTPKDLTLKFEVRSLAKFFISELLEAQREGRLRLKPKTLDIEVFREEFDINLRGLKYYIVVLISNYLASNVSGILPAGKTIWRLMGSDLKRGLARLEP